MSMRLEGNQRRKLYENFPTNCGPSPPNWKNYLTKWWTRWKLKGIDKSDRRHDVPASSECDATFLLRAGAASAAPMATACIGTISTGTSCCMRILSFCSCPRGSEQEESRFLPGKEDEKDQRTYLAPERQGSLRRATQYCALSILRLRLACLRQRQEQLEPKSGSDTGISRWKMMKGR